MNIIFLDIDGVLMPLGSHEYLRSDAAALKAYYISQDQRFAPVNAYDIAAVDLDWYPKASRYIRQLAETCIHCIDLLMAASPFAGNLEAAVFPAWAGQVFGGCNDGYR